VPDVCQVAEQALLSEQTLPFEQTPLKNIGSIQRLAVKHNVLTSIEGHW
jgi:hypothetical protein